MTEAYQDSIAKCAIISGHGRSASQALPRLASPQTLAGIPTSSSADAGAAGWGIVPAAQTHRVSMPCETGSASAFSATQVEVGSKSDPRSHYRHASKLASTRQSRAVKLVSIASKQIRERCIRREPAFVFLMHLRGRGTIMRSSLLQLPFLILILKTPSAAGLATPAESRALASIPEASRKVSRQQIAAWLQASNFLTRLNFETAFEVRTARPRPASVNGPWDFSTDNLELLQRFRYIALGTHFAANQTRTTPETVQSAPDDYATTSVWNGEAYFTWVDGENSLTVRSLAGPGDMLGHGFIFNVMDDRFPCRFHALSRHVEDGPTIDQSLHNGVLTHRFSLAGVPHQQTQYEIRVEAEPPHRLLESTITLFSLDPSTNRLASPRSIQSYVVTAWREVQPGQWIPESAEIRGERATGVDPHDAGPVSLMTRVDRTSFRLFHDPGEVDPLIFDVPMPVGTGVTDERLNLSFRVGEPWLVLDGILYDLEAPLLEHPGRNLGELLRGATARTPPSDVVRREAISTHARPGPPEDESLSTFVGRLGVVILIVGIICAGLWRLSHARNVT